MIRVCVFRIGQDNYCVPADSMEYVYPYCTVMSIPHESAGIEGVINVHGAVVPVIDMGIKCAQQPLGRDPTHKLMLIHVEERKVALHVEEVADVIEVDQENWHERDSIAPGIKMLTGIVNYREDLALLYDPEQFFAAELSEHAESHPK